MPFEKSINNYVADDVRGRGMDYFVLNRPLTFSEQVMYTKISSEKGRIMKRSTMMVAFISGCFFYFRSIHPDL